MSASLLLGCDPASAPTETNSANVSEQARNSGSARATKSTSPPTLTNDGYNIVYANPTKQGGPVASREGDRARAATVQHRVLTPTSPDPEGGNFTLEEAVAGLGTDGTLVAEIGTELGVMLCDLYADKTPNTVANFIGLARARRPFWDANAGAWVTRPYFRDTTFHRVIPEFMIQGGDYLGDGSGELGYHIPDEPVPELRHDRAGLLCMANRGPNTNSAQFFITDGPAPQLDFAPPQQPNAYTVFGHCRPPEVVSHIARVPQTGPNNRPVNPVIINRVLVRRVQGGAAAAQVSRPSPPPGLIGEMPRERGASPDPSHRH